MDRSAGIYEDIIYKLPNVYTNKYTFIWRFQK